MSAPLPPLVPTDWLAGRLGQPAVRVVDGSWYLPASGRDPAMEHVEGHIPGAVFFDLDASSDRASQLPHMLPTVSAFAERMSLLGLDDSDDILVYDGSGTNLSAPRVWWMFRVYGHERVAMLDGGMGRWRREGRPIERGAVHLPPGRYSARLDPSAVRDIAAMRRNLDSAAEQVVDMRSPGRFRGTEPEPRSGLRGGHIPGSRNLPFNELVGGDGTVLPLNSLRRRIEAAGIEPDRPIVATCGSGTSACALIHALHLLGHDGVALYDGAWAEWGGRADTPVATDGGESGASSPRR